MLTPYIYLTYNIKIEKFKEQGDRAYLVLLNHQTPFDQFFVGMALKGPVYYVATEDIFSLGWISDVIRWVIAPIPIRKQTTDITAVMNCIRVAREGGTIAMAYGLAFVLMTVLGNLMPGMKSVIFGFNFLLGVLAATLLKLVINTLRRKNVIHREYINSFLMTRASNFFFDIMVVAGIAAIRLSVLENYWGIMLIMGVVGLVITYVYNYYVARELFPNYTQEQFLMMYGMLTGTASTGTILLREIDGEFKTPAADNMVYQNFPAIVFGFPLMLLATLVPVKPILTFIVLFIFFIVMNVILFRSKIFGRKKAKV